MQLKVLLALLSFRGKNTNLVWPKRSKLAELVGCSENNISKVTSQLVNLGWVNKRGNGGLSKATMYEVVVPEIDETLSAAATVATVATLSTMATQTLSTVATQTLSTVARGIEETNEETKEEDHIENKQRKPDLNYKSISLDDLPVEVSEKVAKDFIDHRKSMKGGFTQKAFDLTMAKLSEAHRRSMSLEGIVNTIIERGWKTFEFEWLIKAQQSTSSSGYRNRQAEIEEINRQVGDEWLSNF